MKNNNILSVEKWNYGDYSSNNYGANSIAIEIGTRTVFYSYDTVVAFQGYNSKGEPFFCVHQNIWGTTTGKHLNWIDGGNKEERLSAELFAQELQRFLV